MRLQFNYKKCINGLIKVVTGTRRCGKSYPLFKLYYQYHVSAMMKQLEKIREKYDLHMSVERYVRAEDLPADDQFIRK